MSFLYERYDNFFEYFNTHYVLHACYRMSTVINTNMFTNGMLALKEQLVPQHFSSCERLLSSLLEPHPKDLTFFSSEEKEELLNILTLNYLILTHHLYGCQTHLLNCKQTTIPTLIQKLSDLSANTSTFSSSLCTSSSMAFFSPKFEKRLQRRHVHKLFLLYAIS